jgi:hypothetical protein
MLVLGVARDAQGTLGIICLDPNSVAGNSVGKAPRADKKRPLQTPSIPQFFATFDILRDGNC